ncbi:DeoR/GlpR family DNA-binding transcription regulator [Fredinandcohnia sp. QZ13]|uniref:DeoR/GlpR family DNA-binding transcription regulator n=1 Tax=Fredinandcohnia sp. QZ13 TaxID=3073144 RepID=UPI0028534008|nr:DeoR/GlpR family DNA-binding transcription regulator [Fredinandcohnia sp. QZ13]MDR4890359.1 DeoR/GlpR family DNA-binding transcription regulator [Fredinandcohnia sp. QZ13]
MLTPERHQLILSLLKEHGVVKLQELIERTNSSESTIRRDLVQLEQENQLKRVHGGAALMHGNRTEPSYKEKIAKNIKEKIAIAKFASQFIQEGDSIFLDAGTTTQEIIPFLDHEGLTVVTNGVNLIEPLLERGIATYLIGGIIKPQTKAMIGSRALSSLNLYRFDKCFLGVNGIDLRYGFTTPDPEEALIKQTAMGLAKKSFILADHTKFNEVSFSRISSLKDAVLITDDGLTKKELTSYQEHINIKVVTT